MVRDWDRVFSSSDLTLISDINLGNSSRQDNGDTEISADQDPFNDFNDFDDWDDFLRMGVVDYDEDTYDVSPIAHEDETIYTNYNFFNPDIFPNFVEEAEE